MSKRAGQFLWFTVITVCAIIYILGCIQFQIDSESLFRIGYDNPNNAIDTAQGLVVDKSYRDFLGLNVAALASLLGAAAIIAAVSLRKPFSFKLPGGRFTLPLIFAISFIMLVYDVLSNTAIVSLDHFAAGILRYDEDSFGAYFVVVIMTPIAFLLWLFSFFATPSSQIMNKAWSRHINPLIVILALIMLTVLGIGVIGHLLWEPYYDSRSFHSATGFGSLVLCTYSCVAIIVGRANVAADKAEKRREAVLLKSSE